MTQFMITTRKAGNDMAFGPARYLTFDDATGPETSFGSSPRRWVAQLIAQFPPGPPNNAGDPTRQGDILFLVHGFNVDHAAARAFHMKCVAGLAAAGWVGQVVSYDWPSDGLAFAYLPDRANARAAASALVTSGIGVLEAAQRADCTINVHVLAHSMGGFVAQQAFTWAYQDVPADWKIGQLLFAAADVDASVFSAGVFSAKMFVQHAGRLTAYCNSYDKALAISNAKRLELAPRMGRVGLPDDAPAMMCEVDCSAYFHAAYPNILDQLSPVTSHTFYFDRPEFWQDVALTLAGGIDRSVFPTREPTLTPNRFDLKPEGAPPAEFRLALARSASSPSVQPPA
ncbi:MAG TPA: alpha/beta fold hydrolase [Caulobacteraceae bacterium]|nr:alpha/beta fold hydrolase [Caulobacteraceae bacterium]